MSEVQKILDSLFNNGTDWRSAGKSEKFVDISITEAKDQLYDLLMEKAIDYDLVTHDFGTPQIVDQTKAIPISTINELFGRTE